MGSDELVMSTQYLTFTLENEDFALDISQVREVLNIITITRVPRMPQFLSGVINLRGNVVPVIDLRLKLGMNAITKTVETCIVIVEVLIDNELTQMGALTDSVKEVIDLEPGQIAPPPKLGTKLKTEFIKGMGKQGERFLIILDIDKILSDEEIAMAIRMGEIDQLSAGAVVESKAVLADMMSEIPVADGREAIPV